jgi:hypothetical protein
MAEENFVIKSFHTLSRLASEMQTFGSKIVCTYWNTSYFKLSFSVYIPFNMVSFGACKCDYINNFFF